MAISFDRDIYFAIGPESVYNTYVSPTRGIRILPGATLTLDQGVITEPSARAQAGQSPYDIAAGLRSWTLSCEMNLPLESLGYILWHLFGTVTTSAVSAFYKHIFVVKNTTPQSCSIRLVDKNVEWELSGGVVSTMTIRSQINGFWKVALDLMGGTWNDDSTLTAPTYTVPASGAHFLRMEDGSFTVNSAEWKPESFEVTFTRNYADGPSESYQLGSKERARLENVGDPAGFIVKGYTRRLYDGSTQYNFMDGFTQIPIIYTYGTIDSATYALKIDLEKCQVEQWRKEVSGGIEMQRLDFTGYYTTSTDIVVTTQDKESSPVTA